MTPKEQHGMDMTKGHIGQQLWKFSIPMLLGSTFQTAYSIVNALWVGNGLGKDAVGAIAVSFPVIFFLMAIAGGLTMATSVLVSQAYGAKNYDRMNQVIQNSLVLILISSAILLVMGYITVEPLLKLMKTPPEILPMATQYIKLFIWVVPFMFVMILITSILRGVGDSMTPLYFQAAGVVITGLLDPFLMFGWCGLPRLGLNGTAWATLICNAMGVIALDWYLHYKKHIATPNWRKMKADWETTWLTLKLGIPPMLQQALVSMGFLIMMGLVNEYGHNATAAFGIVMRIDQLAFIPSMTIGMAVSTLAGQNVGANRYDRVPSVFRWGILYGVGLTAIVSLLCFTIPHFLLKFFVKDVTVVQLGESYLRVMGWGYLLFAVIFVSNGIINGAGHTLATTFFTLIGLWIIRLPLATWASHQYHQLHYIWYAMVFSTLIGTLMSCAYYYLGWWKKPIGKTKLVPPAETQPVD